jgi:hypothetical protein
MARLFPLPGWVGTLHVICSQNTLMDDSQVRSIHVTNLTPASQCNPTPGRGGVTGAPLGQVTNSQPRNDGETAGGGGRGEGGGVSGGGVDAGVSGMSSRGRGSKASSSATVRSQQQRQRQQGGGSTGGARAASDTGAGGGGRDRLEAAMVGPVPPAPLPPVARLSAPKL